MPASILAPKTCALAQLHTHRSPKQVISRRSTLLHSSPGDNKGVEESELESPAGLAGIVESSFVIACSAGDYAEGLACFIKAVMKAYSQGYTVPSLTMEVGMCTQQTAGRPLQAEEVELRTVWMTLVYLVLEKARWPQSTPRNVRIDPPFKDKFDDFVENVMRAHQRGYSLQSLKLEEMMRKGGDPRTPWESAVLSQSLRIVFTTLSVMQEGWTG